jgi:hypothetical protein
LAELQPDSLDLTPRHADEDCNGLVGLPAIGVLSVCQEQHSGPATDKRIPLLRPRDLLGLGSLFVRQLDYPLSYLLSHGCPP